MAITPGHNAATCKRQLSEESEEFEVPAKNPKFENSETHNVATCKRQLSEDSEEVKAHAKKQKLENSETPINKNRDFGAEKKSKVDIEQHNAASRQSAEISSALLHSREKKKKAENGVKPEKMQEKTTFRRRMKSLFHSVVSLMEFYFSDANLLKDGYLKKLIDNSPDGYVDLSVFGNFNKLQALHKDGVSQHVLVRALRTSTLLQLNPEESHVKRLAPIPDITQEEIDSKTVYVEDLPPHANHAWVRNIFSKCGCVVYISLPVYKTTKQIKEFAFVEFETAEEAAKACQLLNNPLPSKALERPGKFPKGNKELKRLQKIVPFGPSNNAKENSADHKEVQSKTENDADRVSGQAAGDKDQQVPSVQECHKKKKKSKKRKSVDDAPVVAPGQPHQDQSQGSKKKKKKKKKKVQSEGTTQQREKKVQSHEGTTQQKEKKVQSDEGTTQQKEKKVQSDEGTTQQKEKKVQSDEGTSQQKEKKVQSDEGTTQQKEKKVQSDEGTSQQKGQKILKAPNAEDAQTLLMMDSDKKCHSKDNLARDDQNPNENIDSTNEVKNETVPTVDSGDLQGDNDHTSLPTKGPETNETRENMAAPKGDHGDKSAILATEEGQTDDLKIKKKKKKRKAEKSEEVEEVKAAPKRSDPTPKSTANPLSRKDRKLLRQADIRRKKMNQQEACRVPSPQSNAPSECQLEAKNNPVMEEILKTEIVDAAEGQRKVDAAEGQRKVDAAEGQRKVDGSEITSILKMRRGQEKKKVEFDPVAITTEFVKGREIRKRKKPKKDDPHLRVIAKKEWLALKAEYIAQQKSHVAALKESLRELRQQETNSWSTGTGNKHLNLEDVFGTKRLKASQEVKMAHVESLKFTPNVIIQWKCSHEVHRDKIKTMFKEISGDSIAYIDAKEEAKTGYIRFKDEASAEEFARMSRQSTSFMARVLPVDQQEAYWVKANEDRLKKLGSKKKEKGSERIARKVFERNKATFQQKATRIVFNEDDDDNVNVNKKTTIIESANLNN